MADVVTSRVSVRALKAQLSAWLARAQAGERVEITSHRRPVARLIGLQPAAAGPGGPLQAAIDAGIISWDGRRPLVPTPVPLPGRGRLVSELVGEGRG